MRIETERLLIRDSRMEDSKSFLQMNMNPNVMKYISTKPRKESSLENEIEKINKWHTYNARNLNFGFWTIELNDVAIGWICFKFSNECNEYELGYRLKEKYWGRGYATECSKAIVGHGFSIEGVNKIVAVALEENLASIKVMNNIGMSFDRKDCLYEEDVVVYSILKTE